MGVVGKESAATDTEARDLAFMRRALVLAEVAARRGEVPVGAVLVLDNKIVGEGYNQLICNSDPSAHAEIIALRDAGQRLQNYRFPGARLFVSIEPCAMCAGALVHARLDEVIFAATEPKAGVLCSNIQLLDAPHFNHRLRWRGGLLADEASAIIRAFFAARRAEKSAAK